jgi:hypothetical protein
MREILEYNPETGVFVWLRTKSKARTGEEAGFIDVHGYRRISINGVKHYAHRLAWWFVYKEWPSHVIDHINRVRTDNRISNLRAVTQKENGLNCNLSKNNSSGATGVSFDKRRLKWQAYIHRAGKKISLGSYENIGNAKRARKVAEKTV